MAACGTFTVTQSVVVRAVNHPKRWLTSASVAVGTSCRTRLTQAGSMYGRTQFCSYSYFCPWNLISNTLLQVNLSLMAVTDLIHLSKKLTGGGGGLETLKLECFPKYAAPP